MKTFLFALAFFCGPAQAGYNRYCTDTRNGDFLISLNVQGGKVVKATYSNQDHGSFDDRDLAPAEYTLQGDALTFGGDLYQCSRALEERTCDCYGMLADGHPDFLGRYDEQACLAHGGHIAGNCD